MSTIEGVAAIPLPPGSAVSGTAAPTDDWHHDAAAGAMAAWLGGAMAGHRRGTPRWWPRLAAYLLVDSSFAIGVDRYQRPGDRSAAHVHALHALVPC